MPPLKPWIPVETLQAASDLDFDDQLSDGLAQIQFTSALPAALDGIKSIASSFEPLPIVVSDRPDAMQYREQQQDQPVPPPVEMPTPPQPSADIPGPDLSPDSGTPVRSAAEMSADMPPTAGEPGGPPLSNGPVWEPSKGQLAPVSSDEPVTGESVTRATAAALAKAGLPPAMAPYIAGIAINEGILVPGTIARDYWSVGGVKAPGSGGSVTVPTREFINGQWVTENASFGRFNSMQEGLDGLAAFVRDSPLFGPVVQAAAKSGDYAGMIEGFRQKGYATDPAWTQKVVGIARGLPAPSSPNAGATPPAAPSSAPTAATGAPEPSPSVGATTAHIGAGPESYANLLTMGKEQGDEYVDENMQPRETGYVLPPSPETLPGDGGVAPQPLQSTGSSNAYPQSSSGSNGSLAGLPPDEELAPRPLDERPVYGPAEVPTAIGAVQSARAGLENDQEIAPSEDAESPLKPVWDAAGNVIGYVQSQVPPVPRLPSPGEMATNVSQGRTPAGQTPEEYTRSITPRSDTRVAPEAMVRDILDVGQNAPNVPGAVANAAVTGAQEVGETFGQAASQWSDGQILNAIGTGAWGALQAVNVPFEIASDAIDAVTPATNRNSVLSMGDAVTNVTMVKDIRTLANAGVKITSEIVQALRNGTAVERLLEMARPVGEAVQSGARAVGEGAMDIGREAAERAIFGAATPRMIQETGGGSARRTVAALEGAPMEAPSFRARPGDIPEELTPAVGPSAGRMATPGVTPGRPDPARPRVLRGQKSIELTQAEEVSRLRLDKFPEDVRADIEAAAKGINFAHEQRRGVLPDAVVQQLAADDLRSVDQIIKNGKIGRAYNPEETIAVRNAVASQASVVRELSEEIAQARIAGHAPELLVARRAAEATKLDGLVKLAEGARAEAGRTLRAYRQQARLIDLNPNEAVERIYKKLGGRDAAQEAVDEYTKMVQDGANPIQLAKFWAGVEAGKITGADLFSLYRRFNMLSGPRTIEVNALSGAANLGYEVVSSALGTVARGRGSEAAAEFIAPLKASGRAFQNMIETMQHGVSMEQAARGDIPRTLSSRTNNRAGRAALTVMETPDRFNAGVDQFFRTMTEDWAATRLAQQQARETETVVQRATGETRVKLTPRSPEWAETVAKNLQTIRDDPSKFPEIQKMADRVTFSDEPGAIGKGLEAFRQKAPLVANLLFPFIRTPYNIASRAVDISPLGIIRTGAEAATGMGRGRENLAPRVRDAVIGTAATLWAYDQAQQGNVTGAGPDDPEKLAALRATGWQPYSVKIGDQYWSYANFAPFSLALSMGAAAHESKKYAKDGKTDTLSMLSDGAARTAKVVTDMTVLAGLGAIVKSIQDPDRYGTQWLSQFLQTLIPAGSALNTVGQAMDPTLRRAERTDVGTQVSQNLLARIPPNPLTPDRTDVPAAQDPLGRAIPNEQTGLGALNPFRPTTERPDPALQPFIDAGVDIGKPKETLTVRAGTVPIALTPDEQRRWNELRGEQIQKAAPQIARAESYRAAGKQGQEIVLKRLLNQATEAADRLTLSEMGNAEVRRRMTEAHQKKAG